MLSDRSVVDWSYQGKPDYSFGTGATPAERVVAWAGALVGLAIYGIFWLNATLPWSWWQYLLASGLAFDVAGGMIANSLNSCKRFYASPVQPTDSTLTRCLKHHLLFTALHVHPFLIGLLYDSFNWRYGVFWYTALLASAFITLRTPLYLRRPVSMLVILAVILLNTYVVQPILGFEWLIPILFIKIVYGHLVREEPYRPARP